MFQNACVCVCAGVRGVCLYVLCICMSVLIYNVWSVCIVNVNVYCVCMHEFVCALCEYVHVRVCVCVCVCVRASALCVCT